MEGTEDNKNKEESNNEEEKKTEEKKAEEKKEEETIDPDKECENIINSHDYYEILGVKNGASEDELVKAVVEKYEVDEETARKDVQSFIETLVKPGIIEE